MPWRSWRSSWTRPPIEGRGSLRMVEYSAPPRIANGPQTRTSAVALPMGDERAPS